MKISETQQKDLNNKLFKLDIKSLSVASEIEQLLDAGADVNAFNNDQETLLHKIAQTDNLAAVELLLNRGADPLKINYYGLAALHYAANYGNASIVKCLLKYNASEQVLYKGINDKLALHLAAYNGYTSVVECLLKYNPSEQALHKSKEGLTAVDSAARNGRASVIEVFLNHLPIDQHLEIYHSALKISKDNHHAHCIAVIEQALLQNVLKDDLLPSINLEVKDQNLKKTRRRL